MRRPVPVGHVPTRLRIRRGECACAHLSLDATEMSDLLLPPGVSILQLVETTREQMKCSNVEQVDVCEATCTGLWHGELSVSWSDLSDKRLLFVRVAR